MNFRKLAFIIVIFGLICFAYFSYFVYNVMLVSNTAFESKQAFIYIKSNSDYDQVRDDLIPLLNDIKTFDDIEHLRELTELDGVYLEYNPVASEFEYRKKVAELTPSLTQIDATMIGGLAQHGYGLVGNGDNLVERMKQMQDTALRKALAQKEEEEEEEEKIPQLAM